MARLDDFAEDVVKSGLMSRSSLDRARATLGDIASTMTPPRPSPNVSSTPSC